MAKARTHTPTHTFSVNFFGTLGYVGMVSLWLLVIVVVIILTVRVPLPAVASTVSPLIFIPSAELISDVPASSPPWYEAQSVRFVLWIFLAVASWLFSYVAGRFISRIIKRLAHLKKGTVNVHRFVMVKCSIVAIGLVLYVALVLMVPSSQSVLRFVLSSLGFTAGILAVAALWVQYTLASRYKVPLDHVV